MLSNLPGFWVLAAQQVLESASERVDAMHDHVFSWQQAIVPVQLLRDRALFCGEAQDEQL